MADDSDIDYRTRYQALRLEREALRIERDTLREAMTAMARKSARLELENQILQRREQRHREMLATAGQDQ